MTKSNKFGYAGALTLVTTAIGCALLAVSAHAQDGPPLKEPIALEGSLKAFYRGANIVIVTTMDGVEHVYHFTKNLIVHGGKTPGVDALADLSEGTPVVIHRRVDEAQALTDEIDVVLGDRGLKITEGRVIRIDRRKKEIAVRYANGTMETFQLTVRAAAEGAATANESGEDLVIYYADEEGHKVAHYVAKKR
jgi:hypothetical protein